MLRVAFWAERTSPSRLPRSALGPSELGHAPVASESERLDTYFGNSRSRMYREVGVNRWSRGLHQTALSSSLLSPIFSWPDAFFAKKIASLIFRPDRRFLPFTSFQRVSGPSLSFGSSSPISRRRHFRSVSPGRLRPPGNIQSLSRRRLTRRTRPFFAATSFDDFAISLSNRSAETGSV